MAGTSFTCPNCGANARSARDIPQGTLVKCPRCAQAFRLGSTGDAIVAEPRPPAPAPPAKPPARSVPTVEAADEPPARSSRARAEHDEPIRREKTPARRSSEDDDDRPRSRRRDDEDRPRRRDDDDRLRSRRDDEDDEDRPRSRRRDDDEDDDRPRSRRRDDDDDDRPARRKREKPKKKRSLVTSLVFLGVFLLMLVGIIAGVSLYAWQSEKNKYKDRAPTAHAPPPGAFGPGGFGGWGGFGGDINTASLRQPGGEGVDNSAPIFKDFTSVFTEPPLAMQRPRRLIGPAGLTSTRTPAGGDLPTKLLPAVLDKVKKATTMIVVSRADGRGGSGSGFFVGSDLVMTNAHVIGMLAVGTQPPKRVEIVLNNGEPDEVECPGEILAVDRDHDLALLRAGKPAKPVKFPEPLNVAGGRPFETQSVYIFGFPLGEQPGKEVTVAQSQVSSLRKDTAGVLERVQVNGGMHPGNSGGPVVDTAGNVVGVAVAVIKDTSIHFAVPAERVSGLLDGHLATLTALRQEGRGNGLTLQITVAANDPLKKIRAVLLDWWVGDTGEKVPAGRGAATGGSNRKTISLNPDNDGRYTGSIVVGQLPPEDKLLWLQVRHRDAAGSEARYEGLATELQGAADLRPTRLAYRPRRGPTKVAIKSTSSLNFTTPAGDVHSMLFNISSTMREERLGQDDASAWVFRLGFDKLDVGISLDDKPLPRSLSIREHMPHLGKSRIELQVNNRGKVTAGRPAFGDVPEDSQRPLGFFAGQLARSLQFASVTYPDGEIQPNHSWTEERHLPLITQEGEVQLPLAVRYTYQGIRRLGAREMAELSLTGEVGDEPGGAVGGGGKIQGYLLVDVATGMVSKVNVVVLDAPLNLPFHEEEAKATTNLEVKLQRE